MEFILISIVFGILWGLWCKSIAEKKNRDGTAGFVFGFFFGIFGVLVYSFLSIIPKESNNNKNKERKK